MKWRDGGNVRQKSAVATTPSSPIAAMAQRHEAVSVIYEVKRRPTIPPSPLPPIARPIASPIDAGCTSSLRYAIEIAGSPANVIPASARTTRSVRHWVANAQAIVSSDDDNNETAMIGLRPRSSDIAP